MREIKPSHTREITDFLNGAQAASAEAYPIQTYRELVEQCAKLAYLNKDHLLFYRGQPKDYRNKAGNSTFYPSIYRGDYLHQREINYRFEYLKLASKNLARLFVENRIVGHHDVKRKTYVQWSILQHYEICKTPLIDLTHSLRVASTFALLNNNNSHGYVYVFGLPYLTNRITINSEHDIVNIRLLSICPPEALRPYFQEGYLSGTTDITNEYDNKNELDFKNRLIAKFRLPTNVNFWGDDFKILPKNAIYPVNDFIEELCKNVKNEVDEYIEPGEIGEFLSKWSEVENVLYRKTENKRKGISINEALRVLQRENLLDATTVNQIDKLKRFRNELVHQPKQTKHETLNRYLDILSKVFDIITKIGIF